MLHENVQAGRCHPFYCENVERKHNRCEVSNMNCDITDGVLAYGGKVEDISLGGFKLVDVPLAFNGEKYTYSILISSDNENYRIIAKPCWQRREGNLQRQDVGFKILDAPLEWVSYAMTMTQDKKTKISFEKYH